MPLSLADTLHSVFLKQCTQSPCTLFVSATDMTQRAVTRHARAETPKAAWASALSALEDALGKVGMEPTILRADWVVREERTTWADCVARVERTRRNYFRQGVALDEDWTLAFTEMELNANAMLYRAGNNSKGQLNLGNCAAYCKRRFDREWPALSPDSPVTLFSTEGVFVERDGQPLPITGQGLDAGRRDIAAPTPEVYLGMAQNAARYLSRQVHADGRFDYGFFSCFDRPIPTYNTLRHISTLWSMLEAYGVFKEKPLRDAIERAVAYCVRAFARHNGDAIFFEDVESGECKLGSNGCALIMLARYAELINPKKYLPLMRGVARGILAMQEADGGFVHVLHSKDFSLKERRRIVYYDGEAVFGMLRLYGLTKDNALLEASKRAFAHFIATEHWKNHDHWLSYAVNELTCYEPRREYFQFGIQNFNGYLDFVANRDTAFPTLLELMLAADEMLRRLDGMPEHSDLLAQVDRARFTAALHSRARQLLNGYFWPEFAMFFKNPARIAGSFFIKHHAFRVRIDDVQHFISGFIGYARLLERQPIPMRQRMCSATIFFGGDVNLGRRTHWQARKRSPLGEVTAMRECDLRIVNLECVIATKGKQGVIKGEGGPYYFRARPEQTNILTEAGVDVVATANNHSGDYGAEALLEQLDYLNRAGIAHAGSGATLEEAMGPAYVNAGNLTVAVFSIDATQHRFAAGKDSPGTFHLPLTNPEAWQTQLAPRIADARSKAHCVFVIIHWGANYAAEPTDKERAIGRLLITMGCDAVLGCSSHQVQGIEIYMGRPIIYDAGNFLFDINSDEYKAGGCFLLDVTALGVTQVRFLPLLIGNCHTKPPSPAQAYSINQHFKTLCEKLDSPVNQNRVSESVIIELPALPNRDEPIVPLCRKREKNSIPALQAPLPEWTVDSVPYDAAVEPVHLGPVTLLGCKFDKELTKRQMLFVETWWRIESTESQNCSFIIHGVPPKGCNMPCFGKGMAHEGCDWMWPTTRWKPGILYREYFGLRPPQSKALVNVPIWIEISVSVNNKVHGRYRHPQPIDIHIPTLPYYRTTFAKSLEDGVPGQTWSASQISAVTGGKWEVAPPNNWYASSIVRVYSHIKLVKGPVLFAANNDTQLAFHEQYTTPRKISFDTHNTLKKYTAQLCGAIVDHVVEHLPKDFPQLVVDDPVRACIELGIAGRKRFTGKEIMITGSSGKTTMCSLLKHILSLHHSVIATYDNYNSRVGAPVIFASVPSNTEYAILEVSSSALSPARGPISTSLPPHLIIITSLSEAHLGKFKTLERIARIKSKIYTGITKNGLTVINRDIPLYTTFADEAKKKNIAIYTYGTHEESDIRLLTFDDGVMHCSMRGKEVAIPLSVRGRHMALAVCGAIACLMALDLDFNNYIERISTFSMLEGRGRVVQQTYNNKKITIIDESYNANPESMHAALESMLNDKTPSDVLILGDMLELGPESGKYHKALAEDILKIEPSRLLLCGAEMRALYATLLDEPSIHYPIKWFENVTTLMQEIDEWIQQNDRILIKSSNGIELHRLVQKLIG